MFPILGLLVGVAGRGFLSPAGDKGWFAFNKVEGGWNREALPLQIALFIWAGAHLATIWHFDQGSIADRLRLGGLGGVEANGFVGYYTALLTGIIAIIVSGMVAERWFTRAMTISSLWVLYLLGAWYEAGFWTNETFSESWAPLIWLAITFFVGVAITMIGNHEKYGGWSNREEHRPKWRSSVLECALGKSLDGCCFLGWTCYSYPVVRCSFDARNGNRWFRHDWRI